MVRPCVAGVLSILLWLWPAVAASEPTLIRVGVYENPPKVMLNEQGAITGIFGDLLNHIATQEGWLKPLG